MLDTVRFVYAPALVLLVLLPLVWLGRRRYLKYLRESRKDLGAGLGASTPALFGPLFRARLAALLFLTATLLLIVALARPQAFKANRVEILRELDLIFLLDASPSMRAEDVAPSRLERATRVIREIVVGAPLIQRVALVTFTRSSLILSYLTSDVENILFYLDFLDQRDSLGIGTNIGAAIASGLQVIALAGEEPEAPRNHPIMVLLSDGEDHGDALEAALQQAVRAQLTVHTIGIASEAGGFVPLRDAEGNAAFLEDQHGTRLISRLDERTLRRVAEVTGGRFYRAMEAEQVLSALREILSQESRLVGVRQDVSWIDLYHTVLAIAAVLVLLGWTLGRG